MDPARIELVAEWFEKAGRDLATAHIISSETDYFDVVVYHCQQAAEKAIKGSLTFFDIAFDKTHNVALLIQQAAEVEQVLLTWEENAKHLTKFATAYRYPGAPISLIREDVEEALEFSEGIVRQRLAFLPEQVRPRDGLSADVGMRSSDEEGGEIDQ